MLSVAIPDVEISAVRLFLGDRVGVGVESCEIVFLGALPIYSFKHFFLYDVSFSYDTHCTAS